MGTTAAQKKLFFNLRKLKGQLKAIEEGDLSPEHVDRIATDLRVREADVVGMNRRLAAPDHSLNAPVGDDGAGEWQDRLADDGASQESALAEREELSDRKALLSRALGTLEERERSIFMARRLRDNPTRLAELSQHYGISCERVRQIEFRAFEKLQKVIMAYIAERARCRSPFERTRRITSDGSMASQLLPV
jgi:RNA polymerase sigma-32 factor